MILDLRTMDKVQKPVSSQLTTALPYSEPTANEERHNEVHAIQTDSRWLLYTQELEATYKLRVGPA